MFRKRKVQPGDAIRLSNGKVALFREESISMFGYYKGVRAEDENFDKFTHFGKYKLCKNSTAVKNFFSTREQNLKNKKEENKLKSTRTQTSNKKLLKNGEVAHFSDMTENGTYIVRECIVQTFLPYGEFYASGSSYRVVDAYHNVYHFDSNDVIYKEVDAKRFRDRYIRNSKFKPGDRAMGGTLLGEDRKHLVGKILFVEERMEAQGTIYYRVSGSPYVIEERALAKIHMLGNTNQEDEDGEE